MHYQCGEFIWLVNWKIVHELSCDRAVLPTCLWQGVTDSVLTVTACDEEWRRLTAAAAETQRLLSPGMPGLAAPMRNPATPLGAPLILSPRLPVPTTAASLLNGSGHQGPLLSPHDPHGLIYTPYADYANYAALAASPLLADYATADHSGGLFARWHWLFFSIIAWKVEKTYIILGLSFTHHIEPLTHVHVGKCSWHISPPCACGEATFILGSSFTSHCMKCFPTCVLVDSVLASASHAYFWWFQRLKFLMYNTPSLKESTCTFSQS